MRHPGYSIIQGVGTEPILSCFSVLQTEDWQLYPSGSVEAQGLGLQSERVMVGMGSSESWRNNERQKQDQRK